MKKISQNFVAFSEYMNFTEKVRSFSFDLKSVGILDIDSILKCIYTQNELLLKSDFVCSMK